MEEQEKATGEGFQTEPRTHRIGAVEEDFSLYGKRCPSSI